MPIRMVDDPENSGDYSENTNTGGGGGGFTGGGGGGLLNFLPLILSLFGGKGGGGKGILILIVVAVGAYFLFFRNNSSKSGTQSADPTAFSKSGYGYSAEELKKAAVYEGLEPDDGKNPLPEQVSLLKYAPQRGDQGQQGSCVAWSSVYNARTIIEAASTGQDPNAIKYSPAFVYNQIGLEGCQGSYIERAMEFMTNKGVVPYDNFPYNDQDCSKEPTQAQWALAAQNKMHGFTRLTESDDVNGLNIRAVKEHLAKDAPVVIGMMVGGTFMQDMMGHDTWAPEGGDRSQMGFGGHALCVVGYDDTRQAFQILNSWGDQWGKNGWAWVKYGDFKQFVREAYGIDPLPKRGAAATAAFECTIGLFRNDVKQYIPLEVRQGNIFESVSTVAPGTKFKLEVKNSLECYTYIFGQESDGTSYTLFPYPDPANPTKTSFSPYCGVTGYRLFPRGKSLAPDNVGTKDIFAIVVTRQPIDWYATNTAITNSRQADYGSKVAEAFHVTSSGNTTYGTAPNGAISFKTGNSGQTAVISVVEVNKK